MVKKLLHRQKRLLSFQNEHLFVFIWSTINSEPQRIFWFDEWSNVTVQLFTLSVNSLKYQFKIANLYITINELFIYYSYRWLVGLEVPIHKRWQLVMNCDVLIILHKLWCPQDFENVPSFLNPRQNTAGYNQNDNHFSKASIILVFSFHDSAIHSLNLFMFADLLEEKPELSVN